MTDESPETISILADLKECPHCGVSLIDDEIEPSRRKYFGGRTHYSKLIAVDIDDRIDHYVCPKCEAMIERTEPPTPGVFPTCNVVVRR
jgi:hypothetical protein